MIAKNQPPNIVLSANTFKSQRNLDTPLPSFIVEDVDHTELLLLSSVGEELQPPITVSMTTKSGLISLLYRDDIVFIQGQGSDDRFLTFRGPIDKVNKALASASYKCRIKDGCMSGYIDTISIVANDEGFRGKGGALTHTAVITVQVT